ncbi:MAG TPA: hypothetical protein VG675_01660 [Bryobacteraceae bacterium]|nr:hypothetical protein [Bryobacteraceae bacterium]
MPDKPTWCGQLKEIAEQLRALPDRRVDRAAIEQVRGVGRRRAQQILAPCVSRQVGASGMADCEVVIQHLQRLAAADVLAYERRRRVRVAEHIEELRRSRLQRPAVLVEASVAIVNRDLDGLPSGVSVTRGQITVRFETATEALEKLLALAMAIGNDQDRFERLAAGQELVRG